MIVTLSIDSYVDYGIQARCSEKDYILLGTPNMLL